MYHQLEYANYTILAVQQFYNELHPTITSIIIRLSAFEEHLLTIWSLALSYYIHITIICFIYIFTGYIIYKIYNRGILKDEEIGNDNHKLNGCERVLFITAHPDDECMFFGPTIVKLIRSEVQVYLVCLSVGDKYGQGKERKEELWSACRTLGLNTSYIWLYKHDKLRDDPRVEWRTALVASIILRTVETLDIDTIITFDKRGISGHKNHISIYRAMNLLKNRNSLPSTCRVYLLESVCLIRKYLFYTDLLVSLFYKNTFLYVANWKEHQLIVSAMSEHYSQYVWYRKLFMIFSRYSYINTLYTFVG